MSSNQDRMGATLAYYAAHAAEYAERTNAIDVSPLYARFDPLLKPGSVVLDLGCGGGRDARHFAQAGHRVIGVDPCLPLLREAERRIPKAARGSIRLMVGATPKLPLKDRCCSAIWACASLLHLPRSEMPSVLAECSRILAPGGVILITVKRGSGEGRQDGRWFTYWESDSLVPLVNAAGLTAIQSASSKDGRGIDWLQLLLRR